VLLVASAAAVLLMSVVLRFVTRSELWFDEALSVNIARLPLSDLREALRHDGAPPLYYVLLHVWIDAFGSGDAAVRAFSGIVSLATLPAMWFAGRRIGGRTVAWLAVVVMATSPYAIRYATESRMYALVMFLVAWGYVALRRALDRPSLGRLAVVAAIAALLLYTQYWSFYLLAVAGAWLLVRAWRPSGPDDRRAALGVIVAFVAAVIVFLPWVSTFRYQLAHTGTPWGDPRVPWAGLAEAFVSFIGGSDHGEAFLLLPPLLILPLLALLGRGLDGGRIELDLRTRPGIRPEIVIAFGALVLGLTASWIGSTAFEGRYASIVFPVLVLVIAFGFTPFVDTRVRAGVVAFAVAFGLLGGIRNAVDHRTQAFQVADVIRAEAKPGDFVVYCPDQVGPDTSRLLEDGPRGLVQLTFPDGAPPQRVDWVDYIDRVNATDGRAFAQRVAQRAGPNHTIWYVDSPGYHNVEGKCEQIGATLDAIRGRSRGRVSPNDKYFEFLGIIQYPARV